MTKRFAIISNHAFSLVNFRAPLLTEIVKRGHEVFALAPDFDDATRSALVELGVTPVDISISRTGLNPFRDLVDLFGLHRILSGLRIDCVMSFALKPVVYGTLAAWLARVPHRYGLIAGLGYAFGEAVGKTAKGMAINRAVRILYTIALGRAERVFVQNPDDRDELVRLNIVPRNKLVLVNGTGVDLDIWQCQQPVMDPVTFMLVGRLLSEKGVTDFVEAARQVKTVAPDARFVILGGLDSNPNAIGQSTVEQWVADGVVEWPGHVDVRARLARASIFVLPSYYREGIPRSILEALACGKPVITTDMPGCRETVVDGENGYFVPPRNAGKLAEVMMRFTENRQLIARMGAKSRKLAEERFDIRKVNAVMVETMEL